MSIIYFDCFSGISGDMIIGALLDAGLPLAELEEEVAKLNLANCQIKAEPVVKKGITATKFSVLTDEHQPHRHISDIRKIIQESGLEVPIKDTVMKIFGRLAEAEGKIHGISPEKIHFHEVGAMDAIIDIVGSVVGLHKMNIAKILASPLNIGGGWTHCMHGTIPVPAPATLELLKGIPIYNSGVNRELVTPTGAAIISTLCQDFTDLQAMIPGQIGYGAGTAELQIPNVLRVIVGEEKQRQEHLALLETNIDDMNPELYPFVLDKLLEVGALDVFYTPIIMKKGRPAIKLSVICNPQEVDALTGVILQETSSLGVRIAYQNRKKLFREIREVITPYGPVKIKLARLSAGQPVVNLKPEYEDCRILAGRLHIPIKEVYQAALQEGWQKWG